MRICSAALVGVAVICPAKVAERSAWSAATWQATSDAVALPGAVACAAAGAAHSSPARRMRETALHGECVITDR